jgi:hypothetical protein
LARLLNVLAVIKVEAVRVVTKAVITVEASSKAAASLMARLQAVNSRVDLSAEITTTSNLEEATSKAATVKVEDMAKVAMEKAVINKEATVKAEATDKVKATVKAEDMDKVEATVKVVLGQMEATNTVEASSMAAHLPAQVTTDKSQVDTKSAGHLVMDRRHSVQVETISKQQQLSDQQATTKDQLRDQVGASSKAAALLTDKLQAVSSPVDPTITRNQATTKNLVEASNTADPSLAPALTDKCLVDIT